MSKLCLASKVAESALVPGKWRIACHRSRVTFMLAPNINLAAFANCAVSERLVGWIVGSEETRHHLEMKMEVNEAGVFSPRAWVLALAPPAAPFASGHQRKYSKRSSRGPCPGPAMLCSIAAQEGYVDDT
jgi:hypothetical protein